MNFEETKSLHTGNCIRTYTGLYMNVFEPTLEMIRIEDIAHALSNMPRFAGHTSEFYSVAQHCILCYYLMNLEEETEENLTLGLETLMHDSPEAYLLDMPKPIKKLLPQYNLLEENMMKLIFQKFNMNYPLNPKIKQVDRIMLELEHKHFMLQSEKVFDKVYTPKQAEEEFLKIYHMEVNKISVSL